MRVRAESKMASVTEKAASVINEKGEAIADLSTQVGEMQAHQQQTLEEYTTALTERDGTLAKMTEDASIAKAELEAIVKQKDESYTALETEMKTASDKADASLKKKNKELSDIGEELRKTTERLATALKDKERAESENYDLVQEAAISARKLAKLSEDNRKLEALLKSNAEKAAVPDTAEGVEKIN